MSKHTPGPWTVDPVTSPWNSPLVYAVAHVGPIAEIRPRLDIAASHPMVAETRNANARLIAAAPDLLAALWAMSTSFHAVEYMEPHMREAAQMARAAIAKATGDSHHD